ncbi:MAG: hypothetical protein JXR86_17705 [Spirochaetales bacterium]|nr:hypothetical protein [Spirochaetales bacterium]
MEEKDLEIIYRDDYIAIINKPAGLLTHQTKMACDRDSVVDRLRTMFSDPPSPVHRLDRATSGLIICTFGSQTARILGESFLKNEIEKEYTAVVRGFTGPEGTIDRPLTKDGEGELQNALTRFLRLGTIEIPVANNRYATSRYSLIRVKPETGRYHQIRRHMAGTGHPVIGDTSHGDLRHNRILAEYWGNERLLLHCGSLSFNHPATGERVSFQAPEPDGMKAITERFRSSAPPSS